MPGPALPTLTDWVQQRINGLYVATDSNAINAAFDAFISKGVRSITVNGGNMSRDQYLQFIQGQKFQETSGSVQFSSTVPANQGSATGGVATTFQVTIQEQVTTGATNSTVHFNITMNLDVEEDPSINNPAIPDARRVFTLTETSIAS